MRLTALLRGVLRSEGEFTTLGRELEIVEAYLDIERARFEQRLRVHDRRAGARCRPSGVPPLILQPLVENAVKHGIAPQRRGGDVTVTARIERTTAPRTLSLTVATPAPARRQASCERGRAAGVGLTQHRAASGVPVRRPASLSITTEAGARHDRRDPHAS